MNTAVTPAVHAVHQFLFPPAGEAHARNWKLFQTQQLLVTRLHELYCWTSARVRRVLQDPWGQLYYMRVTAILDIMQSATIYQPDVTDG